MSDHDVEAAASQLGMSSEWLRKEVKRRGLPHQQYGRSIRFTDEQVAEIKRRYAVGAETTTPEPAELRPSTTRRRRAS